MIPKQQEIDDPDRELVTRAQEGDTRAFDALILKHGRSLYSLVYNMTGNKEDAYDLLQEVFSRAYRALKSYKGKAKFFTWIYQIATNLTLTHLKRKSKNPEVRLRDANDETFLPEAIDDSCDSNPERKAAMKELKELIDDAMDKLSAPHRLAIVMHDIQNMTHAEIAKILEISEGTVRSRLHYGRQQLQSYLQDAWQDKYDEI